MASDQTASGGPVAAATGSPDAGLPKGAASAGFARFDDPPLSPLKRLQGLLQAHPATIPALVLLASIVTFSFLGGARFRDPSNFSLILQQVTVIGIVGIAQTLIILTAGIDLSVGAILVLTSVVMGRLAVDFGWPTPVAIVAGLGVGALCGAINGFLVSVVKLPPFIVTLGTWNIFFTLNLWFSGSQTVRSQDLEDHAPLLLLFGSGFDVLGVRLTLGAVLMMVLVALAWYVLNWTKFGRHIHATGNDPEAAELAGVRTGRTLLAVYTLAGLVCGIAGWVLIGRIGSVSPQAGQSANLDSITAVVIGGTSLFGGRGSIVGTIMGALILGVFRSGLAQAKVEVLWQDLAAGMLMIAAAAIDRWLRSARV